MNFALVIPLPTACRSSSRWQYFIRVVSIWAGTPLTVMSSARPWDWWNRRWTENTCVTAPFAESCDVPIGNISRFSSRFFCLCGEPIIQTYSDKLPKMVLARLALSLVLASSIVLAQLSGSVGPTTSTSAKRTKICSVLDYGGAIGSSVCPCYLDIGYALIDVRIL